MTENSRFDPRLSAAVFRADLIRLLRAVEAAVATQNYEDDPALLVAAINRLRDAAEPIYDVLEES